LRIRLFRRKKSRFDKSVEIVEGSRICGETTIGHYTYIGARCDVTKAEIGRYVSIANNVSIGSGEHHIKSISTSSLFYKDAYEELTRGSCIIESDAWIAVDAIIRRNVRIGLGAVVGANSFVNRDVPDFGIVAGSPAKLIGYRFEADQIERIRASRWWEADFDESKQIIARLQEEIS